jgi:Mrp family chromosome partitioning ATPase
VSSLPSDSSQRAGAQQQLNSDQSQLNSLNGEVATLTSGLSDLSGGSIISSAIPPQKASSPKPLLIVPSGLLAGLLIGLVLAFIAERRDRRIRGPRDLTKYDVPVLMSLPLRRFTPDMEIAAPRSLAGREFAELAHMLAGSLGAGSHVIAVSGSAAGYGTSLVAANLAAALSRNHPSVTLVCADLEQSSITDMVGLPLGPGLTDILASGVPAREVGHRLTAVTRLHVITPGSVPGQEADDLQLDAVERLLEELRDHSQWIVVETPAVASGPDAYTLAHAADATILVVETPKARTDQVLDSLQHLERTGATVLGTVLLRSPEPPVHRAVPLPTIAAGRQLALGPNLPAAEPPDAGAPVSDPPASVTGELDEEHDDAEAKLGHWSGTENDDDPDATQILGRWSASAEASSFLRGN